MHGQPIGEWTDELLADVHAMLKALPPEGCTDRHIREERFAAGLAFVHFRRGAGGRELDRSYQRIVEDAFLNVGCLDWKDRNAIGLGMAAPTVHEHGTPAQQARWLRPCFTGEEIWCQLFSEPGAGSDLAALATSARRDGDQWVINGQKVWTSLAHVAQWGLLLARTDPSAPKHRGITYFCLDMTSAGIDVRPLRQLTGEAEFNEVFLTDVRIPDEHRLGPIGGGWTVAMTTLMNERVSLGASVSAQGSGPIGQAVALYRQLAQTDQGDPVMLEHLMSLWVRAEAARLLNIRAQHRSGEPGPEGSIAKLEMAALNKAVYELCVDMLGLNGALVSGYEMTRPDAAGVHGGQELPKAYLRSRANSIEGGTSEILRNVVAERVMNLPAEPRTDKDVPWLQLPR